jgi:hypothetical protein
MANANIVARFFSEFTPTTWGVVVIILLFVGTLVRVWPLVKAKINEARKIELDANADLRGDLLTRIRELEQAQVTDRLSFADAMGNERARCDKELESFRNDLGDARGRIKELEGYMLGQGRANQEAQRMLSEEREKDRHGRR